MGVVGVVLVMLRDFRRISTTGGVKNSERDKQVLRRVKITNQWWHTVKKISE
jgi:hypothetical protein